jgi:hypothetical protein
LNFNEITRIGSLVRRKPLLEDQDEVAIRTQCDPASAANVIRLDPAIVSVKCESGALSVEQRHHCLDEVFQLVGLRDYRGSRAEISSTALSQYENRTGEAVLRRV